MEAAAAAAVRGGPLVRPRARVAYGGGRGLRRVVGAGHAAPGRRRVLFAVAALPEPLEPQPSRAQEGAVAVAASQAGEEVHGDQAAAETSSPTDAPGKMVRVKFVLKKQCPFGQSFYLVGDDPALGIWDPTKAVSLQWAEGHEWILEKDLPANKLVEFKFLLRDTSGKFHWQNGPNRSLQTGETANKLVVYEDWGDVKNQKVEEEGEGSIGMEQAVISNVGENRNDGVIEDELRVDDNQEVKLYESIIAEEDGNSAIATNASDQGGPVKENKAAPPESLLHEEPKVVDQLHEKEDTDNGSISNAEESYAENVEDSILSEDGVPVENGLTNAYEHDLLWGWKALQQLLMNLGFKTDTS